MMQLAPAAAGPAAEPASPAGRLSRATAEAMQRVLFGGAPGTAELLLDVWNGTDDRRRERSRRALRELNPFRAPSVIDELAHDVALLLVATVYGGDRTDRVRVARLLTRLCHEAARIASSSEGWH